jgi:hypothetical protein
MIALDQQASLLPQFPVKLHDMLHDAEKKGFHDVVSWMPDGNGFRIHDPEALTDILRVCFKQTKYKSFLRQLQNYGFRRVIKGTRKGICKHALFVRGQRSLSHRIKRASRLTSPPSLQNERPAVAPRSLSAPIETLRTTSSSSRQLSTIEMKNAIFNLSTPLVPSTQLFQMDPLISKIPPCEILLPDTANHFECLSNSAVSRELETGFFEGQRFFIYDLELEARSCTKLNLEDRQNTPHTKMIPTVTWA